MDATFIQHYEYTIPAGKIQDVWAWNRFLTILENSVGENVDVSLGGQPFTTFKKGLAYELPEEVDLIQIKNTSTSETTIEFYLSSFRVYDNRVVFTDDIGVKDVANSVETPVALVLNSGNSYKATISADPDQKGIEIQNTGSNDCWYGKQDADVDPAAKRGIKFEVGSDKILPINCALYFESESTDCTISYLRFKKV